MAANENNLIWIDLEMTGLNPDGDRIIEIATVVTDAHLNILAEGPVLAIHQKDIVLNAMDEWNTRQHGESGLTERVRRSKVSEADAEAQTIEFLPDGSFNYRLTNVGRLNTKGVELETAARIGEDLNLNGGVTYLDAKYDQFDAAQCYLQQTAAQGCISTPLNGTVIRRQNLRDRKSVV